jgi:hypothetical protein
MLAASSWFDKLTTNGGKQRQQSAVYSPNQVRLRTASAAARGEDVYLKYTTNFATKDHAVLSRTSDLRRERASAEARREDVY